MKQVVTIQQQDQVNQVLELDLLKANWISSHPAANTNDYLVFQQTSSASTTGIMTRGGMASSDVEGIY